MPVKTARRNLSGDVCMGPIIGLGILIARNPWKVIALTGVISAVFSLGLIEFKSEAQMEKLWVPTDSRYLRNKAWRDDHFGNTLRDERAILSHPENVLSSEALLTMLRIHNLITTHTTDGKAFSDICYKIPVLERQLRQRRDAIQVDEDVNYDYIDFYSLGDQNTTKAISSDASTMMRGLPEEIYCDLVDSSRQHCAMQSLLEIWNFDGDIIKALTDEEIVRDINGVNVSPVTGYEVDFKALLGQKTLNDHGDVVSAKSLLSVWVIEWDPSKKVNSSSKVFGFDYRMADPHTMQWEAEVIEKLDNAAEKINSLKTGLELVYCLHRTMGDASSAALQLDFPLMACGYTLMLVYTVLMLGRPNIVEVRCYLSCVGLFAILMGGAASQGLAFLMGYVFTPMNGILLYLILGIGIDDMFVIIQCLTNIHKDKALSSLAIEEKIGLAMKNAGLSITMTSVTDILAFSAGAITLFPGLQSFCVSCSISLAAVFILQITWFVAWLTLDERRIQERRSGLLPCIKHDEEPNEKESRFQFSEWTQFVMSKAAVAPKHITSKVLILAITLGALAAGLYGICHVRIRSDPFDFLPSKSAIMDFVRKYNGDYSVPGYPSEVVTGRVDYTLEHFIEINRLVTAMKAVEKSNACIGAAKFWLANFKKFLRDEKGLADWRDAFENPTAVRRHFSDFLFDVSGAEFQLDFVFDGELSCGGPAPNITASKLAHYATGCYYEMDYALAYIMEDAVAEVNLTGPTFSFAEVQIGQDIIATIGGELGRNLGIAIVSIFVVTVLTLGDPTLCLTVMAAVALTLANVVGYVYFIGLNMDQVTFICIIITVGMSIDYSLHIAHAYKLEKGTSTERASKAMANMGPAILNGGATSLLAMALLSLADSHPYRVMLKVFSLAIAFGLYHGLLLLPTLLSTFGSSSEETVEMELENNNEPSSRRTRNSESSKL